MFLTYLAADKGKYVLVLYGYLLVLGDCNADPSGRAV